MDAGKIRSVRDLRVWQVGMDLTVASYRLTNCFPKHELYGITSQLRRASVSIPANIAEGFGRASAGDYQRFLRIAQGSLKELETLLEISLRLDYSSKISIARLEKTSDELGKMLRSLISSIGRFR